MCYIISHLTVILYDSNILVDEKVQISLVQQDGNAIQYIKEPSDETKWIAAQQYGYAIQYIKEPSEELHMLVVQQYGCAMKYERAGNTWISSLRTDILTIQFFCGTHR